MGVDFSGQRIDRKDAYYELNALHDRMNILNLQQELKDEALAEMSFTKVPYAEQHSEEENPRQGPSCCNKKRNVVIKNNILNFLSNRNKLNYKKDHNYPLIENTRNCLELCERCQPYTNRFCFNLPASPSTISFEHNIKNWLAGKPKKTFHYVSKLKLYRELSIPVLDEVNYRMKELFDFDPIELRWQTVNRPVSIFHLLPHTNVSMYDSEEFHDIIAKPYRRILATIFRNRKLDMELPSEYYKRKRSNNLLVTNTQLRLKDFNFIMQQNDEIGGPIESKVYREYYAYKEELCRYATLRKIYNVMKKVKVGSKLRKLARGKSLIRKSLKIYSAYLKFMTGIQMVYHDRSINKKLLLLKQRNWMPLKEIIRKRIRQMKALYDYETEEEKDGSFTEKNGSCTEKDDCCVEKDGSHIEKDSSYTEEVGSYVENDGSYIEEVGSYVEEDGSHIEEDDSDIKEDDCCIEEYGSHIKKDGSHIEEEEQCEIHRVHHDALLIALGVADPRFLKKLKYDPSLLAAIIKMKKRLGEKYTFVPSKTSPAPQKESSILDSTTKLNFDFDNTCNARTILDDYHAIPEPKIIQTYEQEALRSKARSVFLDSCGEGGTAWTKDEFRRDSKYLRGIVLRDKKLKEIFLEVSQKLRNLKPGEIPYATDLDIESESDYTQSVPTQLSAKTRTRLESTTTVKLAAEIKRKPSGPENECSSMKSMETVSNISFLTPGTEDLEKIPCYKLFHNVKKNEVYNKWDALRRKSYDVATYKNPLFKEYSYLVTSKNFKSFVDWLSDMVSQEQNINVTAPSGKKPVAKRENILRKEVAQTKFKQLSQDSIEEVTNGRKLTRHKSSIRERKVIELNKKKLEATNKACFTAIVRNQNKASNKLAPTQRNNKLNNISYNKKNLKLAHEQEPCASTGLALHSQKTSRNSDNSNYKKQFKSPADTERHLIAALNECSVLQDIKIKHLLKLREKNTGNCKKRENPVSWNESEGRHLSELSRNQRYKKVRVNRRQSDGTKRKLEDHSREQYNSNKKATINNQKKTVDVGHSNSEKVTLKKGLKNCMDGRNVQHKQQSNASTQVAIFNQKTSNTVEVNHVKRTLNNEQSIKNIEMQHKVPPNATTQMAKFKQIAPRNFHINSLQKTFNNKQSTVTKTITPRKESIASGSIEISHKHQLRAFKDLINLRNKKINVNIRKKSDDDKKRLTGEQCDKKSRVNNYMKYGARKKLESIESLMEQRNKKSSGNSHGEHATIKKLQLGGDSGARCDMKSSENKHKKYAKVKKSQSVGNSEEQCDKECVVNSERSNNIVKKTISNVIKYYEKRKKKTESKSTNVNKASKNNTIRNVSRVGEKPRTVNTYLNVFKENKEDSAKLKQSDMNKFRDSLRGKKVNKDDFIIGQLENVIQELNRKLDDLNCVKPNPIYLKYIQLHHAQVQLRNRYRFAIKVKKMKRVTSKCSLKRVMTINLFNKNDDEKEDCKRNYEGVNYSTRANCILPNLVAPNLPFTNVEHKVISGSHYICEDQTFLNEMREKKRKRIINEKLDPNIIRKLQISALKHFYRMLENKWIVHSECIHYINLVRGITDALSTVFPAVKESKNELIRLIGIDDTYFSKHVSSNCLCINEKSIFGSSSSGESASSSSASIESYDRFIKKMGNISKKRSHTITQSELVKSMEALRMMRRDRLRRTAKLTRKYAKRLCAENPYADFNEALVQIMLQNRPKRYYDKSEESNFKKYFNMYKPKKQDYCVRITKYFEITDRHEVKLIFKVLPECYDFSGDLAGLYTDDLMRPSPKLISNLYKKEGIQNMKKRFENMHLRNRFKMRNEAIFVKKKFYNNAIKFGKKMLHYARSTYSVSNQPKTGFLPMKSILKYSMGIFEKNRIKCAKLKKKVFRKLLKSKKRQQQDEEVVSQYPVKQVNSSEFIIGQDFFMKPTEIFNKCLPIHVCSSNLCMCINVPVLQNYVKEVYIMVQKRKHFLKEQYNLSGHSLLLLNHYIRHRSLVLDYCINTNRIFEVRNNKVLQKLKEEKKVLFKLLHEAEIINSIYEMRITSVEKKLYLLGNFMFRMEAFIIGGTDFRKILISEITNMFIGEDLAELLYQKKEVNLFSSKKPQQNLNWKEKYRRCCGNKKTNFLLAKIIHSFRSNHCNEIIHPIPFTTNYPTRDEINTVLYSNNPNKETWQIRYEIRHLIDDLLKLYDQIKEDNIPSKRCCKSIFPKVYQLDDKDLVYYHNKMCSLRPTIELKACPHKEEYVTNLKMRTVYCDDQQPSRLHLKTIYDTNKDLETAKVLEEMDKANLDEWAEIIEGLKEKDENSIDECAAELLEQKEEVSLIETAAKLLKQKGEISLVKCAVKPLDQKEEISLVESAVKMLEEDEENSLDECAAKMLEPDGEISLDECTKTVGVPKEMDETSLDNCALINDETLKIRLINRYKIDIQELLASSCTSVDLERDDSKISLNPQDLEFVYELYGYPDFYIDRDKAITYGPERFGKYSKKIDPKVSKNSYWLKLKAQARFGSPFYEIFIKKPEVPQMRRDYYRTKPVAINYRSSIEIPKRLNSVFGKKLLPTENEADDAKKTFPKEFIDIIKNVSQYYNYNPSYSAYNAEFNDKGILRPQYSSSEATKAVELVNCARKKLAECFESFNEFENCNLSSNKMFTGRNESDDGISIASVEELLKSSSREEIRLILDSVSEYYTLDEFENYLIEQNTIDDDDDIDVIDIDAMITPSVKDTSTAASFEDLFNAKSVSSIFIPPKQQSYIGKTVGKRSSSSSSVYSYTGKICTLSFSATEAAFEEEHTVAMTKERISSESISKVSDLESSNTSRHSFHSRVLSEYDGKLAEEQESSSSSTSYSYSSISEEDLEDVFEDDMSGDDDYNISSFRDLLDILNKKFEHRNIESSPSLSKVSYDNITFLPFNNWDDDIVEKKNNAFDLDKLFDELDLDFIENKLFKFFANYMKEITFDLKLFPTLSTINSKITNDVEILPSADFATKSNACGTKDKAELKEILKKNNTYTVLRTVTPNWTTYRNQFYYNTNNLMLSVKSKSNFLHNNCKHYVDNIFTSFFQSLVDYNEFKYPMIDNNIDITGDNHLYFSFDDQSNHSIKAFDVGNFFRNVSEYRFLDREFPNSLISTDNLATALPKKAVVHSNARQPNLYSTQLSFYAASNLNKVSQCVIPGKKTVHSIKEFHSSSGNSGKAVKKNVAPSGCEKQFECKSVSKNEFAHAVLSSVDSTNKKKDLQSSTSAQCMFSKYFNQTQVTIEHKKVDNVKEYILSQMYETIEKNNETSDSDDSYPRNETYGMFLMKAALEQTPSDDDRSVIGSLSEVSINSGMTDYTDKLTMYSDSAYDLFQFEQRELREFPVDKSRINLLGEKQKNSYNIGTIIHQSRFPRKYFYHPLMEHRYHFSSIQNRPWWKRKHFDLLHINNYWNKSFYRKWSFLYPSPTRNFNYYYLSMENNYSFRRKLLECSPMPTAHEKIQREVKSHKKTYRATQNKGLWELQKDSALHLMNRLFLADYYFWHTRNKALLDISEGRFNYEKDDLQSLSLEQSLATLYTDSMFLLSLSESIPSFVEEERVERKFRDLFLEGTVCSPKVLCQQWPVSSYSKEDLVERKEHDDVKANKYYYENKYRSPKRIHILNIPGYNFFKFKQNIAGKYPNYFDPQSKPYQIFDWKHTTPYTIKKIMPIDPCNPYKVTSALSVMPTRFHKENVIDDRVKQGESNKEAESILMGKTFTKKIKKALISEVKRKNQTLIEDSKISDDDESSIEAQINNKIENFIETFEDAHQHFYEEEERIVETGDEENLEDYLKDFIVGKETEGEVGKLQTIFRRSTLPSSPPRKLKYVHPWEHIFDSDSSLTRRFIKSECRYARNSEISANEFRSLNEKRTESLTINSLQGRRSSMSPRKSIKEIAAEVNLDQEIKRRIRKLRREVASERYSLATQEREDTQRYMKHFTALENALKAQIISGMEDSSINNLSRGSGKYCTQPKLRTLSSRNKRKQMKKRRMWYEDDDKASVSTSSILNLIYCVEKKAKTRSSERKYGANKDFKKYNGQHVKAIVRKILRTLPRHHWRKKEYFFRDSGESTISSDDPEHKFSKHCLIRRWNVSKAIEYLKMYYRPTEYIEWKCGEFEEALDNGTILDSYKKVYNEESGAWFDPAEFCMLEEDNNMTSNWQKPDDCRTSSDELSEIEEEEVEEEEDEEDLSFEDYNFLKDLKNWMEDFKDCVVLMKWPLHNIKRTLSGHNGFITRTKKTVNAGLEKDDIVYRYYPGYKAIYHSHFMDDAFTTDIKNWMYFSKIFSEFKARLINDDKSRDYEDDDEFSKLAEMSTYSIHNLLMGSPIYDLKQGSWHGSQEKLSKTASSDSLISSHIDSDLEELLLLSPDTGGSVSSEDNEETATLVSNRKITFEELTQALSMLYDQFEEVKTQVEEFDYISLDYSECKLRYLRSIPSMRSVSVGEDEGNEEVQQEIGPKKACDYSSVRVINSSTSSELSSLLSLPAKAPIFRKKTTIGADIIHTDSEHLNEFEDETLFYSDSTENFCKIDKRKPRKGFEEYYFRPDNVQDEEFGIKCVCKFPEKEDKQILESDNQSDWIMK
ncbi:uncharacterized protein isoform X3 [Rhodnius prolixus]|uniref:uncharacterized protein isoform X3 n=1 Tax=Rhodnius prolixus TaxID=13249 RepID=UPI003D18C6C7